MFSLPALNRALASAAQVPWKGLVHARQPCASRRRGRGERSRKLFEELLESIRSQGRVRGGCDNVVVTELTDLIGGKSQD